MNPVLRPFLLAVLLWAVPFVRILAQPANDRFASAAILPSATTGFVTASTQGATAETGEPAHWTGQPARRSIWYRWVAPSGGQVTFTTAGSDFDTLLSAYTGTAVGSLSRLAQNDDAEGGVIGTQSSITFFVNAGTTYRIAVDGYSGAFGTARLSWSLSGPPVIVRQPSPTNTLEGTVAQFDVQAESVVAAQYLWLRNEELIPGTRSNLLAFGPVRMSDNGARFSVVVTNRFGSITSAAVALTILRETTPPVVTRVLNFGHTNLLVYFSEQLDPASVTNPASYTIGPGSGILAAALEPSGDVVRLHTATLMNDLTYDLDIRDVTDLADRPNPIAPGTRVTFTALGLAPSAIGANAQLGTLEHPGPGVWRLGGAGSAIGTTADQFQFASAEVTGDFDVQVKIAAMTVATPYMQAGVMARVDAAANSAFAGVFGSTPQLGSFLEIRPFAGGGTLNFAPPGGFPTSVPDGWLRLKREGNLFTGFASFDGRDWMPLGSATLENIPATLLVGLALSAETPGRQAAVEFRDQGATLSTNVVPVALPEHREPIGLASRRTGIVISEVMYADGPVAGTNSVEFIEIYNAGSIFEDLSGWRLEGEANFTFPAGARIEAGQFLVLAGDAAAFRGEYGFDAFGTFSGRLNSGGGLLRVRDELNAVRLEFEYSSEDPWPVAARGTGHSLVLNRPSYGISDPRAWAASANRGGSPGNDEPWGRSPLASVRINELLVRPVAPVRDFVELYNRSNSEVDLSGAVLTDNADTNRFVFPAGTRIPARGFISVDRDALGFGFNAAGEMLMFRDAAGRVLDAIRFGPQQTGVSLGRSPDGSDTVRQLSSATPGAANAPWRRGDVVINELMYDPLSGEDGDEYVELHNRGTNRVSLAGWTFTDGIDFTFPPGAAIDPGGFVVVARNRAQLLRIHPGLPAASVFGDFLGGLSGSGERVTLAFPEVLSRTGPGGAPTNETIHIATDSVTYFDGGRWSELADGGGSSLELIDPDADPLQAANWAPSDETAKGRWATFETTGVLDNGNNTYGFNQVQVTLQGAGECLVDEIEVLRGATSFVTNGGFEVGTTPTGATGWVFQGNHFSSYVQTGDTWTGRRALHIVAPGRGDTGLNRIRGVMNRGLAEGDRVTIRARARWLAGWPEVLVRLRGSWLELPIRLEVPRNLGTPGRVNSRRTNNAGPAIYAVTHRPVLPTNGEPVRVTARLSDPDGIGAVILRYRPDPATTLSDLPMRDDGENGDEIAGDGVYTATMPGRTPGVSAFRIEAADSAGAATVFPPNAPATEALVRWGDPQPFGTLGHTHMWNTSANQNPRTSSLNNTYRDCTLVYNGVRVIYNAQFKDKGSPFHSGGGDFVAVAPQDDRLLGADSMVFASTGNGENESTQQREQMSYWIGRKLGVPWLNRRYMRLYRNGTSYRNIIEDAEEPDGEYAGYWFGDSGDGELFKIEDWFEFDDNGTGFSNVDARLESYTTTDGAYKTARYRWSWRKRAIDRSANDYTSLFNLVTATSGNRFDTEVPALVDVENWMRVFALERVVGNWDSFGMSRGKNMYIFKPAAGKWRLIPWDIDFTLGSGNPPEDGLFGGIDPAANTMFFTPQFNRAMLRAYRDAITGPLDPAVFEPQLAARNEVLRANGILPASNRTIADYMNRRRTSIESQIAFSDTPLLAVAGGDTQVVSNATAQLSGSLPLAAAGLLVNGTPVTPTWSGSTFFSVQVALPIRTNVLVFAGVDRAGVPIPGMVATVTVIRPGAPVSIAGRVFINEIVASNRGLLTDPADLSVDEDWFELYNPGSEPVDLTGWRLMDRDNFATAFVVPAGYAVPPRGYLLVWADSEPTQNRPALADLHTNFRLSNDGESVVVYDPTGTIVDRVDFGVQQDNVAIGRFPDGQGGVIPLRNATPRASNTGAGSPNRAPAFTSFFDRSLVAGQSLNVQLRASDPDGDRIVFTVGEDAPLGLQVRDGVMSWVPSSLQVGTNVFRLRVTDSGVPPLSAERMVTLIVGSPQVPSLAMTAEGSGLGVRWMGETGVRYGIESAETLENGEWTLLLEVVGSGQPLVFTPPVDSAARWFRVVIR